MNIRSEKGDGPYRGFGYLSLFSDPIDLATWSQIELLGYTIYILSKNKKIYPKKSAENFQLLHELSQKPNKQVGSTLTRLDGKADYISVFFFFHLIKPK